MCFAGVVVENVDAKTVVCVNKGKKEKSHVIRNFVKDCLPTSLYCRAVAPVPMACLVVVSGGTSLTTLAWEKAQKGFEDEGTPVQICK